MKKLFYRVLAFVIDMLICIVLTVLIAQIPFFNPKNSEIAVLYQELSLEAAKYDAFGEKMEEYFKDGELVEDEYDELKNEYDTYSVLFTDINIREEITNKKKDEIRGKVDETYIERVNNLNYKISKANVYQTVISFVVYILYFGIFQWIMKGKTLGKKLLRLCVVNSNDIDKKVPLWSYLVRAILISEMILLATDLAFVMFTDINPYMTANYWISQLRYVYEMAFLIVMVIRDDQRSVHDLLLNTRVMLVDKNNKEVQDVLFIDNEQDKLANDDIVKEEVKKSSKKNSKKEAKEVSFDDKKKSNKTNKNVSKNASK